MAYEIWDGGGGMAGKKNIRMLFIGNSFTARNDLPGMIAGMAAAKGIVIEHDLISAGGASLRMHWNKGEAIQAIRVGKYDYVVLQEQSTLPVKNAVRMRENILLFDEEILKTGARTVLYMTWARSDAPETQEVISRAYTDIGREIGATIVPAGIAWQKFLKTHSHPQLHDRDRSHPTLAGSYLAACVFYAALFGKDARKITIHIEGLDEKDAALLRAAAWEVRVK